jgi:hypothetical protein
LIRSIKICELCGEWIESHIETIEKRHNGTIYRQFRLSSARRGYRQPIVWMGEEKKNSNLRSRLNFMKLHSITILF